MKGTANRETHNDNPVRLMKGYIYKLTDTRNGKIYIGQHQSNTTDDNYYGSGVIVKAIRRKYGKNIFNKKILTVTENVSELDELEQYYIKKYQSNNPKIGYNLSPGGQPYTWLETATEHQKRKWREKISVNHADVSGSKNPMYNKTHSASAKERISLSRKNYWANISKSEKERLIKIWANATTKLWENDEYRKTVTAWRNDHAKHTHSISQMHKGMLKWHENQGHILSSKRPGSEYWYSTTPIKEQLLYNIAYMLKTHMNKQKQIAGIAGYSQSFWAGKSEDERKHIQKQRNSGRRIKVIATNKTTHDTKEYSSITELIENLFGEKWTRVEHERVKKALNTNKPYRGYILNKR